MNEEMRLSLQQLQDYYEQMRKRIDAVFAIDSNYIHPYVSRFSVREEIRPEPFPASINPDYQEAPLEEIVIKGKHPFKMYYQRPKATQLELFPK